MSKKKSSEGQICPRIVPVDYRRRPGLLSVVEAADYLGCTYGDLQLACRMSLRTGNDFGPKVTIINVRTIRYRKEDLDEFLELNDIDEYFKVMRGDE